MITDTKNKNINEKQYPFLKSELILKNLTLKNILNMTYIKKK